MANLRSYLEERWFPKFYRLSIRRVQDWIGHTLMLEGVVASSSNTATQKHPHGCVFRQIVENENGALGSLLFVPLCHMKQSITGELHTPQPNDLDSFFACINHVAYGEMFLVIEVTSDVDTCVGVARMSETIQAR